jgi:hypothetical protein
MIAVRHAGRAKFFFILPVNLLYSSVENVSWRSRRSRSAGRDYVFI